MSPRGNLPTTSLVRIALLIAALVAVVVMKSRCGTAIDQMFKTIDQPSSSDASTGRD